MELRKPGIPELQPGAVSRTPVYIDCICQKKAAPLETASVISHPATADQPSSLPRNSVQF